MLISLVVTGSLVVGVGSTVVLCPLVVDGFDSSGGFCPSADGPSVAGVGSIVVLFSLVVTGSSVVGLDSTVGLCPLVVAGSLGVGSSVFVMLGIEKRKVSKNILMCLIFRLQT